MTSNFETHRDVGPVLNMNKDIDAMMAAIRHSNADVRFIARSSYVRVLAPGRCVLTRKSLEAELGHHVQWPGFLEAAMPSFQGHLLLLDDEAEWFDKPEDRL